MKTIHIRINFFEEGLDQNNQEADLFVPDNIDEKEVFDILQKTHHYLDFEDSEDIYGYQGRNPETLLDYVCEKQNWSWQKFNFDLDFELL